MKKRAKTTTRNKAVAEIVDRVLHERGDIHVVVGPLVHRPDDGHYFIVSSCGEDKDMRCDGVYLAFEPEELRAAVRQDIVLELIARRPIVVHDTGDELYAAKLCEILWPGERITRIRKAIEQERVRWHAEAGQA
jgi:hypothetical protein